MQQENGHGSSAAVVRAERFAARFGFKVPIMLAPMAGASAPALSIAVCRAGGLGACGVLMMNAKEISEWADVVRSGTDGPFQLNTWVPDPPPNRDAHSERLVRELLGKWGPEANPDAGDAVPPDFGGQLEAMLEASPAAVSSVMGLFSDEFVARLKRRNVPWFANVSSLTEALAAEAHGADVIVVQGSEAGGHRAAFDPDAAERAQAGLFSLLPVVVDAVKIPVVATGGIADARGVAAALLLGASAVQIGTGFLRSPEAGIAASWAKAIGNAAPEDTCVSRVFSGRAGRSIRTAYVAAATDTNAPAPAPYPVQRGLTLAMRTQAQRNDDIDRMQAWAGQSGRLVRAAPAGEILRDAWNGAKALLS